MRLSVVVAQTFVAAPAPIIRATEEGTGTDTVEDVLVFTTAGTEGCLVERTGAEDGGTCVTESNLAKGTRGRACCSEDVS
jgi:hypothetical protein